MFISPKHDIFRNHLFFQKKYRLKKDENFRSEIQVKKNTAYEFTF